MYRYHIPHFIIPQNTRCCRSFVLSHPVIYHTPKHTLWVFGRAITLPHLSHPLFVGPMRAALYHRGYTIYHTPHSITHPVIIFSNLKMLSPGFLILCHLRYADIPASNDYLPIQSIQLTSAISSLLSNVCKSSTVFGPPYEERTMLRKERGELKC